MLKYLRDWSLQKPANDQVSKEEMAVAVMVQFLLSACEKENSLSYEMLPVFVTGRRESLRHFIKIIVEILANIHARSDKFNAEVKTKGFTLNFSHQVIHWLARFLLNRILRRSYQNNIHAKSLKIAAESLN